MNTFYVTILIQLRGDTEKREMGLIIQAHNPADCIRQYDYIAEVLRWAHCLHTVAAPIELAEIRQGKKRGVEYIEVAK